MSVPLQLIVLLVTIFCTTGEDLTIHPCGPNSSMKLGYEGEDFCIRYRVVATRRSPMCMCDEGFCRPRNECQAGDRSPLSPASTCGPNSFLSTELCLDDCKTNCTDTPQQGCMCDSGFCHNADGLCVEVHKHD